MTEKDPEVHVEEDEDELDSKLNYKPPPQKTLQELQELDKDDESLIKYKKSLLGDGPVMADPTVPNVTVTRLTLVCDSAPGPITMDLTGDLDALKKESFVLKEGAEYKVKIHFKDSEQPEFFLTLAEDMQDIPFGICTNHQVLSHYNITTNTISLFRMVDNKRQDLEIQDNNNIDVAKLSHFIRINELRWVTKYNPMTAVGLFDSAVQTHLLLFSDKTYPKHMERINKCREAAVSFQGKILFILVDINTKGNDRVLSYFHLKKSQLPALAAYYTPDEEQDVLPLDEVSLEAIKGFCTAFWERKEGKNKPAQEDKLSKEEL